MTQQGSVELHRGLQGVYFDRSKTCFIDGRAGKLQYRGYSIDDLATHSSFEEVAYLLLQGKLPAAGELAGFEEALKEARPIPPAALDVIRLLKDAHPMDVLRTAVSALSAFDPDTADHSREAVLRKSVRLTSQIPTIVAAHHAIRQGREPVEPDLDLAHAANFLYMLGGERPSAAASALIDTDMVLHAEHGSNASSFTARVVTATEADLHSSITAAIAALSGPRHGGAAENVMKMAQEIGEPEQAAGYIKERRSRGEPIMGFGHRVYRTEDPRARHLREGVRHLSEEKGEPRWYAILEEVLKAMQPFARRGVNVNVDFYSGVIYYLHGIPQDLFVPIFAIGRVPGWAAQVLEQAENNILIRPLLHYTGPIDREYTPIGERT